MVRPVRAVRPFQALVGAGAAFAMLALCAAPADAHHWRHYYVRHVHAVARYHATVAARPEAAPADPAFAAIVVDANSGRILYGVNENEPRHPASITKVMTLYLLFEQLDKGALTLQSPIPISERAAAQEPSKLGLEPGQTIAVEDAIKAIVTRSANDVAVAIAEKIGGDENAFAAMMTRKAHALGMSRTVYRNASGLPDDQQVTTARDLTILARAVEERFPRYFRYFSTREFDYAGEAIGNHNRLLGRIDGVDGVKTGYTRASGFNLLTSLHRDGRSLVAVVMGGRTAPARDALMEQLIADHIAQASNKGRTAPMIAQDAPAGPAAPLQLAAVDVPSPPERPSAAQIEEGDDGDADDEDGAPVVAAAPPPAKIAPPAAAPLAPAPARLERLAEPTPQQLGWVKGPDPAPAKPQAAGKGAAPAAAPAARPKDEVAVARSDEPRADDRNGWVIQIGASDDEAKVADLLTQARAKSGAILASAKPLAEKVAKGEDVFYRARFAGLDSASAESACRSLKKSGFSCFAARD
ncbi:MAG: D-alanyl-D-alanine carboxypeptidase family protein [Roseiarcus sp.]